MRLLQFSLAVLTIAAAIASEVAFHVWWSGDASSALAYILADAPMIMAILGALLAIAIAGSHEYEFTIALVPVNALALLGAVLMIFGNPLALLMALLLALTTIVTGLLMNRAWREGSSAQLAEG